MHFSRPSLGQTLLPRCGFPKFEAPSTLIFIIIIIRVSSLRCAPPSAKWDDGIANDARRNSRLIARCLRFANQNRIRSEQRKCTRCVSVCGCIRRECIGTRLSCDGTGAGRSGESLPARRKLPSDRQKWNEIKQKRVKHQVIKQRTAERVS